MDEVVIAEMRIRQFNEEVADHATFCGGGSVAAVTAAGAASLVLLVLGLAEKRKANTKHKSDIRSAIQKTEAARARFHELADGDATALDALLRAQAELRGADDRSSYQSALLSAALAPMETAEECLNLLRIIDEQMRRATRFTVSDLGAAGTLAFGALQAATMMADINLALLKKEPDTTLGEIESQLNRSTELVEHGRQHASAIDSYTRTAIRGKE